MPSRLHGMIVLAVVASLLLSACALDGRTASPTPSSTVAPSQPTREEASTPTAKALPQPTATPATAGQAVAAKGFAYIPGRANARPAVAPYSFALDKLGAADLLRELDDAQKQLLERNGFVVTPRASAQIYDIYKQGKDRNIPLFITTDAVLHTYHILFDFTLRSVELEHLMASARDLTRVMVTTAAEQYRTAASPSKEAAGANLAYFAVALRLFDPSAEIPADVRDVVAKELALIDAHAGYAVSPIFGYREDYSQYVPRGHYTRNEEFKAYFRGMMWYGRMGFRLKPGETPDALARGRAETRRALLIVSALERSSVGGEQALRVWDRIYAPTSFFVGGSDDLTVYDYQTAAAAVYGQTPAAQDLSDTARLDAFIAQAMQLRSPRIVSSFVTDREQPELATKSFRFMGQRFVPDSYIFQQLVYDKVGGQNKPRLMPKGLDIFAVFGSQRAYEILDKVYQETAYTNYDVQMTKLRGEFGALAQAEWTQNLYWGWLYTLLPLTTPKSAGYPSFMLTPAWVDKELNTALGSWAELRHDTILYAKQSTTMRVTEMQPRPTAVRGYVEPNAELYTRLAALAAQTRRGLQERGLLSGEFALKLANFETFVLRLKAIAEKELENQALSEDDYTMIREVGAFLESIATFTDRQAGRLASEADKRMAIVADVHTDTNSNQALEVAVGDAFPIYVIAPVEGKPTLVKGAVFSYYEFSVPLAQRLTDEQWQALTPKPDRPQWTESFIR